MAHDETLFFSMVNSHAEIRAMERRLNAISARRRRKHRRAAK